jgi:hypothetical protein
LLNFTFQPLYPYNISRYPLNRRLASFTVGLEISKKRLDLGDIRTTDLPARRLVTVLTALVMWYTVKNNAITLGVMIRRSLCVVVTNRSIR